MRVAIVGAGGSGMAAAHYLSRAGHTVTILEKNELLGGNIRTLNKNVAVDGLDPDITLEAGVIEFPSTFSTFRALMDELGVPLEPADLGTALFYEDGKSVLSPSMIARNREGIARLRSRARLIHVMATSAGLMLAARRAEREDPVTGYRGQRVGRYLEGEQTGAVWMKSLIMYSYSIPYGQIEDLPAEMAIPAMRKYMRDTWYRIPGGVYSYVEKILEGLEGEARTGVDIESITRGDAVRVVMKDGEALEFDQLVFACPPDQVLALLKDPTDDEKRRFFAWKANHAQTVIHTDDDIYRRHDIPRPSEFDFFQRGDDWGYNAALNGLCGVEGETHYHLSYNIEPLIDPARVVHVQAHHTPLYTAEAFRYREEVRAKNGENRTWHAGAWLGDGLHEGAIASGKAAADGIGRA
jgi:predicted NAD/FAD-binding protein